jgi:hypothetical protein
MRAATTGGVRRVLALVLVVVAGAAAPAVAVARPAGMVRAGTVRARVADAGPGTAADRALARIRGLEQRGAALGHRQAQLVAQQQGQLATVDRLKRQRASWRRDRQLQAALAVSLETAKQLGAVAQRRAAVAAELAGARRAALTAIDAELGAVAPAVPDPRRRALAAIRATLAAQVAPPARKIVLPDEQLDPLADPEELDQQAAALRQGEAELARQAASLARQAASWQHQADLRRQHERARDLALRDDDQPRRTTGGGGASGGTLTDPSSPSPQDNSPTGGGGGGAFEGQPEIVLAEVIDPTAVDALRRAERSTDPAAKAAAAAAAHDQVEVRLARLRQHRAAIEARARELRAREP